MPKKRYYDYRGIRLHSFEYNFQTSTGVIDARANLEDVVAFFKVIDRGVRHVVLNGQKYSYLAHQWKEMRSDAAS